MILNRKKIRKKREIKDYSQEYVAEKLGISQTAYSKLENGQTNISVKRLTKLAEILEISESNFFESNQNISTNNSPSNNVKEVTIKLIENQKENYEKTIKVLENQIDILNKENQLLRGINDKENKK